MSFRSWRERLLLSQEKVAQMSGLSLRTVRRMEAAHRVSYASLRALATAFKTDVDVLEREFYAVNGSSDEFVEVPRWARLLGDRLWFGGPRLSRRAALLIEAFCIACAVIAFAASFLVSDEARASAVRVSAFVPLAGCYLTAVLVRAFDRYTLWPGSANAPAEKLRTWRNVAAEYGFLVALGILGIVAAAWLVV